MLLIWGVKQYTNGDSNQVDGERVVSGSYDHLVKVWALATGECLQTLAGHQAPVLTVAFDANKIISGAADKTIKVRPWDR